MVIYNTYQAQFYVSASASFGHAQYVHHCCRIRVINHYVLGITPNAPNGAQKRHAASKPFFQRGLPSLPKANPEMQIQHQPPGFKDHGV